MSACLSPQFASSYGISLTRGFGADAQRVCVVFSDLQTHALSSVVLGKGKKDALNSLYEAFCEALEAGWDGYGASATAFETYEKAKYFIQALPANFPTPEIAIDPDGEVSLDWYRRKGREFSVSVGSDGQLSYAGKFSPTRKVHGTELFSGQIPVTVLDNLRRLYAA